MKSPNTANPSQPDTRPNVLLITVDQWPGHLLGSAGHPEIETPTLDRLASIGTRFSRAYSETPICIPARRTMMTGSTPRSHGDRVFNTAATMPDMPALAQCFRDGGYQATAVGKLHVYPQRDRIGFDDVLLAEEGRPQLGAVDDYDLFLADKGHAGRQYLHGMSNNEYSWRPWHLPEDCHITNWATSAMARTILRRDPTRPAFWYLSYTHPHPPLVPLADYLERYRSRPIAPPLNASWAADFEKLPHHLKIVRSFWHQLPPVQLADARRAFYALCTHIDHQLRVVLGTLREAQLLDNTIILFTSDHGDMLGDSGFYAKRLLYEGSANIPFILVGGKGDARVADHAVDNRLVGLQDVMPTLLELAGLPIPQSVDGLSLAGNQRRELLYTECLEDAKATRMVTDERFKLIWYPAGNIVQLFDLLEDPKELTDLSRQGDFGTVRARLETALVAELYGVDLNWIENGALKGFEQPAFTPVLNRGLSGQRGLHYPQPPTDLSGVVVGTP